MIIIFGLHLFKYFHRIPIFQIFHNILKSICFAVYIFINYINIILNLFYVNLNNYNYFSKEKNIRESIPNLTQFCKKTKMMQTPVKFGIF